MNPHHVLARRRAERESLLARAGDYVATLERSHPLHAAVVFGSVARGDFNVWSDIDLLVVGEAFAGSWQERSEALGAPPAAVQPIAWTPGEWTAQLARGNPIAREAVERGVWLRGTARAAAGGPDPATAAHDASGPEPAARESTMPKDHGSQIKDDEQYEALRREGMSKEKAARIANAGSRSSTGRKGGRAGAYEDRSKEDLYRKAKEVGIEGRSKMSKDELIRALRDH